MVNQEVDLLKKIKPWYRRRWLLALLGVGAMILIFAPFYIYQLISVYRAVKSGAYISPAALEEKAPYKMEEFIDSFSPVWGAKDAPVSIIEFGDFNCPRCLMAYPIFRSLMNKYQDKVRFYWRNFPVVNESSIDLAKAGVCANKQGKFWGFHDKLFQKQGQVEAENIFDIALSAGIDASKMKKCVSEPMTLSQVKKDFMAAQSISAPGTPTFLINGFKLSGVISFGDWEKIIGQFLKVYDKNSGN